MAQRRVSWFPGASATKDHVQGASNSRNLFSPSSGARGLTVLLPRLSGRGLLCLSQLPAASGVCGSVPTCSASMLPTAVLVGVFVWPSRPCVRVCNFPPTKGTGTAGSGARLPQRDLTLTNYICDDPYCQIRSHSRGQLGLQHILGGVGGGHNSAHRSKLFRFLSL